MRGREKILYLWADGCVRAAGDDMYVLTAIFSRRKSHAHWTATLAAFSPQVVAGVDIGHTSPLTCPSPDLSNASYQRHDRGLHDDHHHRAYLRAHCLSMCAYRSPLFFLFRTRTQNLFLSSFLLLSPHRRALGQRSTRKRMSQNVLCFRVLFLLLVSHIKKMYHISST